MTQEEIKKRLPVWAKILIALVIVGIVGGTTLAISAVVFMQKVHHDSTDPQMIAKAAGAIATFAEPLPKGYKYLLGYQNAMPKFALLTINHEGGQSLMLLKYSARDDVNADTLVDRTYETGFSTPQAFAKFESVINKGTLEVGGDKMPYLLGNMTDQEGHKLQGLFACVVKKKDHDVVCLYGIQPGGAYDMEVTEGLLMTIKSL
jgi:hypothetical protein